MDKLGKAIRELVGDMMTYAILAKVISLDENRRTANCQPLNGDAIFKNCRLNAQENNENGFVFIPKINSIVIIMKIDENKAFVAMFSQIDKVLMNAESIEFNGGANGGLILIEKLIEKINRLENNFLVHLHTNGAGPTGTPQDATFVPIKFLPTQQNEIENNKIKH